MTSARNIATSRKSRRGTDNRQRQAQVAVRLNPEELAAVQAAADRTGVSLAAVLREAFMSQVPA
jgi:Ribbon-helix-helix protein, copG family